MYDNDIVLMLYRILCDKQVNVYCAINTSTYNVRYTRRRIMCDKQVNVYCAINKSTYNVR